MNWVTAIRNIIRVFVPRLDAIIRRNQMRASNFARNTKVRPRVGVTVHRSGYIVKYKEFTDWSGYKYIKIGYKTFRVHRLVAECWVENDDEYPVVHHIDHNKVNNAANNLEWVTQSENILYAVQAGRHWSRGRVLSDEDVRNIRSSTKTPSQLSWQYDISRNYVYKIRGKQTHKNVL